MCNAFMLWEAQSSSPSVRAGDILLDQSNGNLNLCVILHQRDIWDWLSGLLQPKSYIRIDCPDCFKRVFTDCNE